jgi:DNA-directed RNA polymerase specialized sigma24 family protein
MPMLNAKHVFGRFRTNSNDVSSRGSEEMMLATRKAINHEPFRYAKHADFCRIFEKDMSRLYLLSLLLTGNHSLAEKCFVRGFDDSLSSNPVFADWAESWAVRKIVQNAIEIIHPRSDNRNPNLTPDRDHEHAMTEPSEVAQILTLPAFERFAFVLSVLERYSDQECAPLLDCTVNELVEARIHAMQNLGKSAGRYGNLNSIGTDGEALAQRN